MATDVAPQQSTRRPWSAPAAWIRAKDPALLAVKRSVRAAIFMPAAFGIAHATFSDAQVSLFAAFGSFALLLLVDFSGPPRTRLISFLTLWAIGASFIALGTAVSTNKIAAVATMAVVGFVVLFSGILAPQAATAATASLLTFVLPVAVAQPTSQIGPRILGWAIAGALGIGACMLMWPTPWHDDLRRALSATVSAMARLAGAHAQGRSDPAARAAVVVEVERLRAQFSATPYPPTGAARGAIGVAKLMGRIESVADNASLMGPESSALALPAVRAVNAAVAETLECCAPLICDHRAHPVSDPGLAKTVADAAASLDQLVWAERDRDLAALISAARESQEPREGGEPVGGAAVELLFSLDPGFHARTLGVATEMIADATLEAAGAPPPRDRLGAVDAGPRRPGVLHLIVPHLSFRSVWFRNALRGAMGLALAVAVVEATDVEHGFWVVLGTLSVLRSNALGTGATALRAIGGTVVGFVIGSAIMAVVGDHSVLLWGLLPLAVLVAGTAPSMISFAAGQAGFTVVVVILFNIIDPIGWRVGLTRIEDVAIGCAVSVVVGFLFWPRGATAALGRALSEAFATSSGYLDDAVDRVTTTTRLVDTDTAGLRAGAAMGRLDDAFRQFIAERGAKVVPVETVSKLFTGAGRIRLAAFTLASLPTYQVAPDRVELESVRIAGAVLRDACTATHHWYEQFAEFLAGRRATVEPIDNQDETVHRVLLTAFEDAVTHGRDDRLGAVLRMLWADELMESQRRPQAVLAESADRFDRRRRQARLV